MKAFEALPDEKRRRIMNAALALFAVNGYKKTAVDDIVAEAGISKGSIFYYFGSKRKFFLYLYEYAIKLTNDTILRQLDRRDSDLFSRMWKIQQMKLCLMTDYPSMYAFTARVAKERDESLREDVAAINKHYRTNVMSYAREGINTSRFRSDVHIDDVISMMNWVSEGFVQNIVCKTESDIVRHMAEFSRYTALLEKCCYR
jgi:Transcriptional regulator